MNKSIDIGIVGIGRMGWVHARHLLELEHETGLSRLAAVVDLDVPKTRRFAAEMGYTASFSHRWKSASASLGPFGPWILHCSVCFGHVLFDPTVCSSVTF